MRYEEYTDDLESSGQDADPMNEVFEKIEQANLYKALLNEQLFDPNSANPEVIEKVTEEVRQFVLHRMQVLVGQTPDSMPMPQVLPFTEQQVAALKIIADRVLQSDRQRQVSVPKVMPTKVAKVRSPVIQKPNIQKSAIPRKPVSRSTKEKTANVSEFTGQDYSQAVNRANPPIPMPTQATIDARNAMEAGQNQANMGRGDWDKVLQTAAAIFQKQNANIEE